MLRWKYRRLIAKLFRSAAKTQLRRENEFANRRASGEVSMSPARPWAVEKPRVPVRLIAASFAAGVGAMVFVGLVAPTIAMGGLSLRAAAASTLPPHQQLIEPLNVPAIKAQLATAQAQMDQERRETDPMVERLSQLARD